MMVMTTTVCMITVTLREGEQSPVDEKGSVVLLACGRGRGRGCQRVGGCIRLIMILLILGKV